MLVCDNQQAMKSWFTAILEGEGSFRNTRCTEIRIVNTDKNIIELCENFLKVNHIWFVTTIQTPKKNKAFYTIRISNSFKEVFQYATVLYALIESSLECRRDEYQAMLRASTTTRELSIDFNWLAGIYEAEGSFDLRFNNLGKPQVLITLPNTNPRIIAKVEKNLAAMQCGWHIRKHHKKQENHTQCYSVSIGGMKRAQRFLEVMDSYWMSSISQKLTKTILKFITLRLSHPQNDPYTDNELRLVQSAIDINRK